MRASQVSNSREASRDDVDAIAYVYGDFVTFRKKEKKKNKLSFKNLLYIHCILNVWLIDDIKKKKKKKNLILNIPNLNYISK
jgi:hypothetical protein